MEFNLSHAGGWGLLAIGARRRLGVDIDVVRPARVTPGLIRTVTSSAEQIEFSRLSAAEQAYAFYRLWVRKEAVIKALGTGLSRSLATIDVPIGVEAPLDGIVLRPGLPERRRLCLWDLPAPTGWLASIVVEHEHGEVPSPPQLPTVLSQTQIDTLVR
ncbi:MAG: 4'-phosphopantetheinyl transferase superfamily protein [Myxococcota bacterium]